ncbi:NAD(P)/FAD-dependent oxidoreductase [Methanocella arvoryzae]|uniref:NADH dehydrogenase n=1 Tax=Methanocella arvoryzae (strain DSM 22066 / NBRC 105507 / MRE50) TaxID=351160 RepID=Q0W6R5_METAR|nr:FAD-dependent oxidoreductase [Methanocella arvoryzae]CAJ35928.1 putative NADH dehydrogenase [Methanocella arvoryzae MRE50]
MNGRRIVFVGAGGAGLTAAFTLARRAPDAQITVFSKDPVVAYSQCGMPFVLDRKILDFNKLVIYQPPVFKDLGLDVRTSTAIEEIDLDGRAVTTEKGERVEYDRLVIATGSRPFVPPVPGVHLPGVHTLLTLEDGKALYERLKDALNVVIIGGGPIGLETAPAFLDAGAKLTIIERVPQLMPSALDPEMAAIVQAHLEQKGARVITGRGVDSINGTARVESVTCAGEVIPADLVLLSAGIRPNTDLAKQASIDLGVTGGIVVDEYFRVRRNGKVLDDVLAAGDCAEVTGLITGKPVIYAVGSVANRQAKYVADNLLGKKTPYPPVLCPAVCVIGDLHVGNVGLTTHACEQAGITPLTFSARGATRARYYPGGKTVDIKLLSDGDRLVGGQIIGEEGVGGRINVLSLAIGKGMSPADLAGAETCYAPPVSPLIDPLTYAAEMLALKVARAKKSQ